MTATNRRIYLSPPHMSGNEMNYIREAFATNWIAPLGPNVEAFEKDIAAFCGVKHVLAVSSGTAAIHLSLLALGIQTGDEVIVSTFTFSATVNPIVYQGAIPVFVDSESKTWNMDPEMLEVAIKDRLDKGKKPKAIILVHLYGMPAMTDKILHLAEQYDIPVIEDAAEAFGSRFNNRTLGSFGKCGILSFNGNKILNTSGGGALLSDDEHLIDYSKYLATQARDQALHYEHSRIGYNYRMSNILAGVGRGQMEVLNERISQRRENFSYYKRRLGDLNGIEFLEEPGDQYFSNHWLTTVVFDPESGTDQWQPYHTALEKQNIESRPLWKPMHKQPVFLHYPAYLTGVSERLYSNGLCLPSGSNLTPRDRDRIASIIRKTYFDQNQ